MNKKEASKITGGLSAPGKMPEGAYSISALHCQTGAKLRKIPGTPCHGCYALKNRYIMPIQAAALERRFQSLTHPLWVQAMAVLIKGKKFFRWHDSGDLQGPEHLKKIFEVCKLTPETSHWLPTQERKLLQYLDPDIIPTNLIIRLSNAKNDTKPGNAWPYWSTVVTKARAGHVCPAPEQGNNCGSCRACWNKDVKEVQYKIH
jgi:hypothetical protein